MLDPQASFCGESSGGVTNCRVVDPGEGPGGPGGPGLPPIILRPN